MRYHFFFLFFVGMLLSCSPVFGVQAFEPKPVMCQVYFSSQDDLAAELIARIDQESDSIKCAVYCLTHSGVAQALIRAHARGVDVHLIVDPQSFKGRATLMKKMSEKNIPLYIWNALPTTGKRQKVLNRALMHDKFCVFGKNRVWTGSFNFTRGASVSHCENAVFLEDEWVAASFLEEFEHIKPHCVSYAQFIQSKSR